MEKSIKNIFYRSKLKWEEHPIFASLILFFFFFAIFTGIYINNPGVSAIDDHFFYYKYSFLVRTDGWSAIRDFDWIYLTKNVQEHTGWWPSFNLYQAALIPFTFFKNIILGLVVSDIFWGSLTLSLAYFAFRKMKVAFPFFFVLILLTSYYFSMSIIGGRSYVLTIGLVPLEMFFAASKKYKSLFFLTLIHILWHPTTFFFPIIVTGMTEVARYVNNYKISLKNLISSLTATMIGVIVAFRPFYIIWSYLVSLFFLPNINNADASGLGAEGLELYVKNPWNAFWGSKDIFFLLAVVNVGVVIFYYLLSKKNKNDRSDEQSSILMYSVFLLLIITILGSIMISGRFYNYYFIATVMLSAILLAKLFADKKLIINSAISKYFAGALVVFFVFASLANLINMRNYIYKSDFRPIKETTEWIENRSNNKDKVFLQDWSWFPVAFFYNSKDIYSMGIEPQNLYTYSKKLYWKWYNMYKYSYYCDKVADCFAESKDFSDRMSKMSDEQKNEEFKENGRKIIESIKNEFGAKFILSGSEIFNRLILSNPDLIVGSFESKSQINTSKFYAFQLK